MVDLIHIIMMRGNTTFVFSHFKGSGGMTCVDTFVVVAG